MVDKACIVRINVKSRCVRVTVVVVQEQEVLHIHITYYIFIYMVNLT
jgi:hypothetical protein